MIDSVRGAPPQTGDDGSRRRRTKKTSCQASGPARVMSVSCPSLTEASIRRLCYTIRVSDRPSRFLREVKRLVAVLRGECVLPPSVAHCEPKALKRVKARGRKAARYSSVPPPVEAPRPPRMVSSQPKSGVLVAKQPARALRDAPIPFVPQLAPDPALVDTRSRVPPDRLPGGVLRARQVENISYDVRVHGTFLEAEAVRTLRKVQWEHSRKERSLRLTDSETRVLTSDPVVGPLVFPSVEEALEGAEYGFPPSVPPLGTEIPWPKANISYFELCAALTAFNKAEERARLPVTDEQLEKVKADAWAELDARISRLQNYVPVTRDPALEAAGWYGAESML